MFRNYVSFIAITVTLTQLLQTIVFILLRKNENFQTVRVRTTKQYNSRAATKDKMEQGESTSGNRGYLKTLSLDVMSTSRRQVPFLLQRVIPCLYHHSQIMTQFDPPHWILYPLQLSRCSYPVVTSCVCCY